ncbi:TPA: hypothetical protein ACY370_000876 [Pasteurella multocida]
MPFTNIPVSQYGTSDSEINRGRAKKVKKHKATNSSLKLKKDISNDKQSEKTFKYSRTNLARRA